MKQRDILFLLLSSVILVLAWIVFTILHNSIASTINETVSGQIVSIPGSFDAQTIESLKKRQQIDSLFAAATPSATITPTVAPIPTPTTSGTPSATFVQITPTFTPSPTATQGGSK